MQLNSKLKCEFQMLRFGRSQSSKFREGYTSTETGSRTIENSRFEFEFEVEVEVEDII
jgi:hypothetical protein